MTAGMDDLREPALSFDGQALDVGDLVLIGRLSGTWPAFAAATSAGLALEAAGTCQVANDEAPRVLAELVAAIGADG